MAKNLQYQKAWRLQYGNPAIEKPVIKKLEKPISFSKKEIADLQNLEKIIQKVAREIWAEHPNNPNKISDRTAYLKEYGKKKYYAENREKRKEYSKKYYAENREELKEKLKEYREKRKEKTKEYWKKYYAKNKKKIINKSRRNRRMKRMKRR